MDSEKKKILVIDDQEEILDLVVTTLKSDQFLILQAERDEEAIDIALKENPNLILMDIMMSGDVDGLESTRKLKLDHRTKKINIIMLTSKGQKEDYEKGFMAGADDYFIKPFSPLGLIRKVEEVLK